MLKNANPRYFTLRFIIACDPHKNGCFQCSLHAACGFDSTNPSNGESHRRANTASHYTLSRSENAGNAVQLCQIQPFFAGLSFLFNLQAKESYIFSAYYMSAMLFIAALASQLVAILLFLYEISRPIEALSLHIVDIRQSGR